MRVLWRQNSSAKEVKAMSENQNIEWKASWRDEYLKWICGFANAQGGKIYIGTNDSGAIIGVTDGKKLLEDIPNKIQTTLGIVADVNLLSEDGKDYIEIVVNPSNFPVNTKVSITTGQEAPSSSFEELRLLIF